MKDFMFIFRQPSYDYSKLSPKEMENLSKRWQDWLEGIKIQGKLTNTGPRIALEGNVLKAGGVVTDGPFIEIKEIFGGFMIVKADHLEEATTLAHGCPALEANGSVEIRPIYT